ncbi:MAG TPA: hypothetical protein VET51_06560 [Burkholderiales bacterium]|nr:hypothetical protein [Burkholderiales bacterium]
MKESLLTRIQQRTALVAVVDLGYVGLPLRAEKLDAALLERQDLVLIATDHDAFDYALVLERAPLIVDTRGRFLQPAPNVVKA